MTDALPQQFKMPVETAATQLERLLDRVTSLSDPHLSPPTVPNGDGGEIPPDRAAGAAIAHSTDRGSSKQISSRVAPIVGTILAERYSIQSLLGRGGFGITFLARNINLPGQPPCVIKQLALSSTDAREIATLQHQFYLEAATLSRLGSHAQIPTLLDYFHIDTDLYLVEEYIPGIVLSQSIDRTAARSEQSQTSFTEPQIEDFLLQMLRLLEYIHSHRTIHRDIKPQNIILCQTDRRFVLVDFGAVKDLNASTTQFSDRSDLSRSIGTPGFAPPEQLANRTVYASDIYALGMTCVYLLTGKEPNQLPIDPDTCELVWADTVEISPSLGEIIRKTIQVSLADRYQSASEVLNALANRSVRATLKAYLDQKYAISKTESIGSQLTYPAVIDWALRI
jgi:serine/threonine protein kinase